MSESLPFDRDAQGNVITKPVLGWTSAAFGGTAVLLSIRYADTLEEVESKQGKRVPLLLSVEQSLALAALLTKQVDYLKEFPPQGTVLH